MFSFQVYTLNFLQTFIFFLWTLDQKHALIYWLQQIVKKCLYLREFYFNNGNVTTNWRNKLVESTMWPKNKKTKSNEFLFPNVKLGPTCNFVAE